MTSLNAWLSKIVVVPGLPHGQWQLQAYTGGFVHIVAPNVKTPLRFPATLLGCDLSRVHAVRRANSYTFEPRPTGSIKHERLSRVPRAQVPA